MFNGMTVWTKNLKIFNGIIFRISVFMVNSKNFFYGIKSAAITAFNEPSPFHHFSYCGKFRFKTFFGRFIHASFGAVLPFFRWGVQEFFGTMIAFKFFCSFRYLRFMITFPRAIFCFVGSSCNYKETFPAHFTISGVSCCISFCAALSGAIQCCFKSILRYIEWIMTGLTIYNFPGRNSHYASI